MGGGLVGGGDGFFAMEGGVGYCWRRRRFGGK